MSNRILCRTGGMSVVVVAASRDVCLLVNELSLSGGHGGGAGVTIWGSGL